MLQLELGNTAAVRHGGFTWDAAEPITGHPDSSSCSRAGVCSPSRKNPNISFSLEHEALKFSVQQDFQKYFVSEK